jgi:hypothetical protein
VNTAKLIAGLIELLPKAYRAVADIVEDVRKRRRERAEAARLDRDAVVLEGLREVERAAKAASEGFGNDITQLVPSFITVVERLLADLRKAGLEPVLHETYRTPERALMLSRDPDGDGPRKAPGSARSIHCHGAAVDIICGKHKWACAAHGCDFFPALGELATNLGLYWGGYWKNVDSPHVQGIPATGAAQNKLRALKTWAEKDAFVRARLKALP